jgi:hypothetical protein
MVLNLSDEALNILAKWKVSPDKKLIMISGPYTHAVKTPEDMQRNLDVLNLAAAEVFKKGYIPIVGVNMALPMVEIAPEDNLFHKIMMPVCLSLAMRCDAVLRIGGASDGADAETNLILALGGRVYRSLDEIPDLSKEVYSQLI